MSGNARLISMDLAAMAKRALALACDLSPTQWAHSRVSPNPEIVALVGVSPI
jgi:hypothetical protein